MQRLIKRLKFYAFGIGQMFQLTKDPDNTELLFRMFEEGQKHREFLPSPNRLIAKISSQSEFMEMYNEDYRPAPPNLEELTHCPVGSLGEAYGQFIRDNNLDIEFYHNLRCGGRDELFYLMERFAKTHDMYHVLAGFGTSPEDELAVLAMQYGQTSNIVDFFIVTATIALSVLRNPLKIPHAIARSWTGYKIGKNSKPMIGFRWEEAMNLPLEELRRRFSVKPLNAVAA